MSQHPEQECSASTGHSSAKTAIHMLVGLTFLIIGTALVFHVQLFSGLRLMQPDSSDPRLVNYVLERNHQWFLGQRSDEGFWSPPFLYPWKDIGTHTESLLGVQPFFSAWRLAGVRTETSYQLCSIGLLVGCYIATWIFLRRGCDFGPIPATVGAFVFAFSNPRSAQIGHVQMFAHYATPLAFMGLVLEFREGRFDHTRWQWIWLFSISVVVQFYASVYLVWFLLLFLVLTLAVALLLPPTRAALLSSLRCKSKIWAAALAFAGLASLPLFVPYLRASRKLPGSSFAEVFALLPQPESFLYAGYGNWIGNFVGLNQWKPIATLQFPWEHALSPGCVTTVAALAGLWIQRRSRLTQLSVITAAIMLLVMVRWPGGFTLWRWVFEVLPGAEAIRAVSRVGLLLLLIVSYGVASTIAVVMRKWGTVAAAGLVLLIFTEQGQTQRWYDKHESMHRARTIARALPEHCEVFFYTGLIDGDHSIVNNQLDAMWAGLVAGVPTVNGYTGHQPPGWWEAVGDAMNLTAEPEALSRLASTISQAGATADSLCVVRIHFEKSHAAYSEVLSIPLE